MSDRQSVESDRQSPTSDLRVIRDEPLLTEVDAKGFKPLHVRESTWRRVKALADRLDRSLDSVVSSGLAVVEQRTAKEPRRLSDREWAEQIARGESS